MDARINLKQALRVVSRITSEGERTDDGYVLNGLNVATDFDGYTVSLFNDYVRLDIFFHNTSNLEYTNGTELEKFLDKLAIMDK